ncbi:MAG: PepSY domain-containing protein [Acidobacteriota bacterium]
MILFRLSFFMTFILAFGGDQSSQTPKARQNYFAVVKASPERQAKVEREWRRMLEAYNAPPSKPDLHPITCAPRSLAEAAGKIDIISKRTEQDGELRSAVKQFIDRWRDLLGADPDSVSLISVTDAGDARRLIFKQANYPFPVAGNFGEMTLVVSPEGRLLQLEDRFIPVVETPVRPEYQREDARKRVAGRSFAYRDAAGKEQREQIAEDQIAVKQLVILPIEKGDRIEVRLAWEIIAGGALSWTVYIDAITGEELQVTQNFQT